MPTQFNILWKLGSASGWSILISIGVVVLLALLVWVIIKGCKPKARLSTVGMIAAGATALLLVVQLVPAVAAINLKSTVNDAHEFANTLIDSNIIEGGYFDPASDYVDTIAAEAHSFLNNFITKALLIALVETIIGISIVIFTLESGSRAPNYGRRGTPVRGNKSNHNISRYGKSHSNRSRRHRI